MRALIILLAFISIVPIARAQEAEPQGFAERNSGFFTDVFGGANVYATLIKTDDSFTRNRAAFVAGVNLLYHFSYGVGIYTGVVYSTRGADSQSIGTASTPTASFVDVPFGFVFRALSDIAQTKVELRTRIAPSISLPLSDLKYSNGGVAVTSKAAFGGMVGLDFLVMVSEIFRVGLTFWGHYSITDIFESNTFNLKKDLEGGTGIIANIKL